jgi:hypothetical protein
MPAWVEARFAAVLGGFFEEIGPPGPLIASICSSDE